MRNALVYVLNNFKKHVRGARGLDPYSSARWFEGWRTPPREAPAASPVARAVTWLASAGWRKVGLLRIDESPATPTSSSGGGRSPRDAGRRARPGALSRSRL